MANKSLQGGKSRPNPVRAKTAGRSFVSRMALLGIGLAVGGWVAASLATVHGLAQPSRLPQAATMVGGGEADAIRVVHLRKINKFKRIAGPSIDKDERLALAALSHTTAQRPSGDQVRDTLQAALQADADKRRVAALLEKRPETDAIRTALVAALGETVAMAPKSTADWAPLDVAEEQAVASAEVDADANPNANADTLKVMAAVEVEQAVAEAGSGALPEAGPVPVRRPAPVVVAKVDVPAAVKPARVTKPSVAVAEDEDDAPKALAFARPDNPTKSIGRSIPWPDNGTKIAVYDITNGVVHMPNGEKLEAHSGIGEMRDNPKFTHVKMRGPTPPGTYKLAMREKLFHGVAAIRLNPIDGVAPKGRTGLLAHSYLLARKGDSHGCVAFANYDRFLKAFRRGDITHMVIVDRHDGRKPTLAVSRSNDQDKPQKTLVDYFRKGS